MNSLKFPITKKGPDKHCWVIRTSDIGLYQRMDHGYMKKDKIAVCIVVCEKIAPEILRTIIIPHRNNKT